jgi:rhodanese-related sulfurtransferase
METKSREIKDLLYDQVARIGKFAASPKRLELLELLCQGESSVEALAENSDSDVKNVSAHLRQMKAARLVETRREGKYVYYRLADASVASFWVAIRVLAEDRLLELQKVVQDFLSDPQQLAPLKGKEVLAKARQGEIVVVDVRPKEEFEAGHLPYARSIPLKELREKLHELPLEKAIVAYCRGPYCMWATDAVALLRQSGYQARRMSDGVAEWRSAGLHIRVGTVHD